MWLIKSLLSIKPFFTVEWYFNSKGISEVKEYFDSLSGSEKIKLLKLVKRIGDVRQIYDKTKFNNEGDKIYAFKPMPHRFLSCFTVGSRIIILSAFHKKTQKLPFREKCKALKLKKDYEQRIQEHIMKNEQSTFDRLMADSEFKSEFDIEYAQFEAQEQLLELMENSKMSVRA